MGVWRLRSSYSLSRKLYCSAVIYPVCSSPRAWGWAPSLAERERSGRALCRGTTCSGIHLWSQHAQRSARDRQRQHDVRGSPLLSPASKFQLWFAFLHAKSAHSTQRRWYAEESGNWTFCWTMSWLSNTPKTCVVTYDCNSAVQGEKLTGYLKDKFTQKWEFSH